MSLDRIDRYLHTLTDLTCRAYETGWRKMWLTEKQAAVFADRGMAKPANRGEASDIIDRIAKAENWRGQ